MFNHFARLSPQFTLPRTATRRKILGGHTCATIVGALLLAVFTSIAGCGEGPSELLDQGQSGSALAAGANVAAGKPITASSAVTNGGVVTDGNKASDAYAGLADGAQ